MYFRISTGLTVAFLLIACSSAPAVTPTPEPTQPLPPPTLRPSATFTTESSETPEPNSTVTKPAATSTLAATNTPTPWQDMPIVPTVSDRAREIYANAVAIGRNPKAFAKVADCEGSPSWFLGAYDGPTDYYQLGDYEYLREAIDYFAGSFQRVSVAANPGFVAASLFAPFQAANSPECKSNESPLICELRVTNAAFAFMMLGTNDVNHQEEFEPLMRRAIEDAIARGVLPILATKADNLEQDNSINATIVRLAHEYDIPLWNFWAAVQHLPDKGLQSDGAHLTWAGYHFDDPETMKYGAPIHNLTALQALDAVWRGVTGK